MVETVPRAGKWKGFPKGEAHPRARLTDHEVELIRQLREQGMSLSKLADKFETYTSTIKGICDYKRRC